MLYSTDGIGWKPLIGYQGGSNGEWRAVEYPFSTPFTSEDGSDVPLQLLFLHQGDNVDSRRAVKDVRVTAKREERTELSLTLDAGEYVSFDIDSRRINVERDGKPFSTITGSHVPIRNLTEASQQLRLIADPRRPQFVSILRNAQHAGLDAGVADSVIGDTQRWNSLELIADQNGRATMELLTVHEDFPDAQPSYSPLPVDILTVITPGITAIGQQTETGVVYEFDVEQDDAIRAQIYDSQLNRTPYLVRFDGFRTAAEPPQVANWQTQEFPESLTVVFNEAIAGDTVDGANVVVNGFTATSAQLQSANAVTFELDPRSYVGDQSNVAALRSNGKMQGLFGTLVDDSEFVFASDLTPPLLVSTSIANGDVVSPPPSVSLRFNEPVRLGTTGTLIRGELLSSEHLLSPIEDDDPNLITIETVGLLEDNYQLQLSDGGIIDEFGNPHTAITVPFSVDYPGVRSLRPQSQIGSPFSVTSDWIVGAIHGATDVDEFEIVGNASGNMWLEVETLQSHSLSLHGELSGVPTRRLSDGTLLAGPIEMRTGNDLRFSLGAAGATGYRVRVANFFTELDADSTHVISSPVWESGESAAYYAEGTSTPTPGAPSRLFAISRKLGDSSLLEFDPQSGEILSSTDVPENTQLTSQFGDGLIIRNGRNRRHAAVFHGILGSFSLWGYNFFICWSILNCVYCSHWHARWMQRSESMLWAPSMFQLM
ncbi:MAG: hypothetical protein KDB27_17825, partial [Planctomycetales bacterium]|nr:hypothetical protein [Planctomycetales bacterium]